MRKLDLHRPIEVKSRPSSVGSLSSSTNATRYPLLMSTITRPGGREKILRALVVDLRVFSFARLVRLWENPQWYLPTPPLCDDQD
eukprot:1902208-Rhodomonas_salina.1